MANARHDATTRARRRRATGPPATGARAARPPASDQYLTLQPYGVVLATVTGLPAIASVNAART